MKTRSSIGYAVIAAAAFWVFAFSAVPVSEAVEAHHPKSTEGEKAPSSESPGQETKPAQAAGGGSGMMAKMHRSGEEGDPGMMGEMGQGMMHMMMSHMTGGQTGGMGKMMGKMGSRLKDGGGAPPELPKMVHMLDGLDLSQAQWEQVRSLARKRLEKMVDLWAQRMKLRIELAAIRWDQEVDPQKVKDLFVRRAEAGAELFLGSLDYLQSLRAILTREQIEELEAQGL